MRARDASSGGGAGRDVRPHIELVRRALGSTVLVLGLLAVASPSLAQNARSLAPLSIPDGLVIMCQPRDAPAMPDVGPVVQYTFIFDGGAGGTRNIAATFDTTGAPVALAESAGRLVRSNVISIDVVIARFVEGMVAATRVSGEHALDSPSPPSFPEPELVDGLPPPLTANEEEQTRELMRWLWD